MQNSNSINNKRDNFRQEIRRRQVEQIFAESRRNYQYGQQMMEYEPANSYIMQRCLIKNQLVGELPALLPSLANKIASNRTAANMQFVLTVSSNILLDSITLQQKQYIYNYCVGSLQGVKPGQISPLVEVYFYMTVMNVCYDCLSQPNQIQIQTTILPKIVQMLEFDSIDFSRAPVQYSDKQRAAAVVEDALSAILYYYCIDGDHNNCLLYKVKRTVSSITLFINWSHRYMRQISVFDNFTHLLSLTNTILNNISTIPYQLQSLFTPQCISTMLQVLINQIYYQNEYFDQIKGMAINTINILYKQLPQLANTLVMEDKVCLLLGQLEKSVCLRYQIEVIKLFTIIVGSLTQEYSQMTENALEDKLNCVISAVIGIIKDREQDTNEILLKQALSFLKTSADFGYQRGDSSYINFMRGIGMEQLLDGLYIKIKNQDIIDEIDNIYRFIDIC